MLGGVASINLNRRRGLMKFVSLRLPCHPHITARAVTEKLVGKVWKPILSIAARARYTVT